MTGIAKRFGDCHAVRDASLEVAAGEIHALVGENGAGKSTLMRILAGISPPDAGTIEVGGRNVTGWTAAQAIDASVGMVHQHFMLVPTLTIAENVILGREPTRGLAIDFARAEREVAAAAEKSGFRMNVRQLVRELSVGEQQRVEILKTLVRGARILILDEPTAVLSPPEVEELWRVLRALRDEGDTIILITHKLDEVTEISDTITVVREGRTVTRFPTAGTSPASIARAMVGRDVVLAGDAAIARSDERAVALAPALDVRHLVVAGEQ
ncbi:MAG: ATP-binding cassette domain-containing protein, partial [Gemmatimonadota bacterium]